MRCALRVSRGSHGSNNLSRSNKYRKKREKKKGSREEMHDFCFTIPYGLVVLAGGLVAYARKGSTASLAGGVGSGLVLLLAGFVSLKAFEKRRNSYLALIIETG